MDNRPIGVFDSGLGGLTVVKYLLKYLPGESIVYFGDTGRVPYGSRSDRAIARYARQDIDFLRSRDVKMIIAACGTVSSVAYHVIEGLDIPSLGVVEPAVAQAVNATKNRRIGVIGTAATVESNSFVNRIRSIDPSISVVQNKCPLFVPLVESGWFSDDDDVVIMTAKRYLEPLMEADVDTIILGCTHYPILTGVIQKIVGDGVTLINSGAAAAGYAARLLDERCLLNQDGKVEHHFFVSDTVRSFEKTAGILLGAAADFDVKHVDIENY